MAEGRGTRTEAGAELAREASLAFIFLNLHQLDPRTLKQCNYQ